MKRLSGFGLVSGAALLAGIAGYVVTWIVARQIGPSAYAVFAVFWSAMYLVVSTLSGVQQEVARATQPAGPETPRRATATRDFGVAAAVGVAVVVTASAPVWIGQVFPEQGWALVPPLAVATSSYVLVACLSGALYGIAHWRAIAALIVVDGALRLLLLGVASTFTADVVALAWAAALPFPLAISLIWPVIRRGVVGRTWTDVGLRGLAWNVARTVTASASLGAMVGGLPLLIALLSPDVPAERLGVAVLAITLVRAPLIVGVQSLQSYLVVLFRGPETRLPSLLARISALVLGVGVVLALLGWWLGPPLFLLLFGDDYSVDGGFIVLLVASSVLVAIMCVLAAAALARGRHFGYGALFLAAAVATVVALAVPGEFGLRVAAAAIGGPLAGLAAGLLVLGLDRRRDRVA